VQLREDFDFATSTSLAHAHRDSPPFFEVFFADHVGLHLLN